MEKYIPTSKQHNKKKRIVANHHTTEIQKEWMRVRKKKTKKKNLKL